MRICARRSASHTPTSFRSDPVHSSARAARPERTTAIDARTIATTAAPPSKSRFLRSLGSRASASPSARIDSKRRSGSGESARVTIRWTQSGAWLDAGGGWTSPRCALWSRSLLLPPANGSCP